MTLGCLYLTPAKPAFPRFAADQLRTLGALPHFPLAEGPLFHFLGVRLHHQRDYQSNRTQQEAEGEPAASASPLVGKNHAGGNAEQQPNDKQNFHATAPLRNRFGNSSKASVAGVRNLRIDRYGWGKEA